MGYDRLYFLKKAYGIYPGVRRPVSGPVLAAHYERRRQARSPARALIDAVVGLAFLVWIPWRARRVQTRFGLDPAWRRWAVMAARAHFADPQDLALFRLTPSDDLGLYIRRFEDAALNKRINPGGWRADCALADKARFQARCVTAGLPHPRTVATLQTARLEVLEAPAGRDLVVKPVDGEGGDGVVVLPSVADGADLKRRLTQHPGTRRGRQIVQLRVAPHADLADLALNALPTVRIVTIRNEADRPEVVSATLRCAADPGAVVDNMKAGGLIAAVDLPSGTLGPACYGYGGDVVTRHPCTDAAIQGRRLPDWNAARALAIRAHAEAFQDYALVGWDIALSPTGPLLIEGNGKPGVLMPQRAAARGLAQGRYGELLAHHLATKA